MPKFKIKANVTERHSGNQSEVTGTVSASDANVAHTGVIRDMTRHGYRVDGDVKVERDS